MVSTLISPVTQVALVAVKNASTSGMPPAMVVILGMLNSQVPTPMSTTKLKMKMTAGCKWTRGSLDPGRIHSNNTATNKYPCTKKVLKLRYSASGWPGLDPMGAPNSVPGAFHQQHQHHQPFCPRFPKNVWDEVVSTRTP